MYKESGLDAFKNNNRNYSKSNNNNNQFILVFQTY